MATTLQSPSTRRDELSVEMAGYEVAEYMVTTLDGTYHPAMLARPGSGIIFDGVRKQWVLELDGTDCTIPYDDIYRATFEARDQLMKTANTYRKKLKQPPLDLNTNHNWEEVEDSVQDACNGLEKLASKDRDMSGSLGKLKRGFRGLCRNAGAGQTAAQLIPNDSFGFTSVLCGSLKVVFTGLRTTGLYRLEVYRTLEDLPQRLKDLAADVKMHDRDEEIHRRAAALYAAAFNLLNHILHWFLKNTWITGVKLLVDPSGFTDKLRNLQAEMKTTSQSFEARLNKLSRETEQESVQLQYMATYNQAAIQNQLHTIRRELTQERISRVEVLDNLSPLLNNILNVLHEKATIGLTHKPPKLLPDIEPEQILTHFMYEPDLVRNDCMTLSNRAGRRRRTSYDANRLIALQSHPRLLAWLTVDEPSLLLSNARADPRPDSEASFCTAQMFGQLLEHHQTSSDVDASAAVIPLGFFCGQHRDWQTDSNGSADEVAMSLLLQLVDRGRNRLDPVVLRRCYARLKPQNLRSICSMLEALIRSLDPDVVLIIVVDGLRFFAEPTDRRLDTRDLVSCLVGLYRDKVAATLKLLFASPTRSDFVEDLFFEEEVLGIPRDLPSHQLRSPARSRKMGNENFGSDVSDEGF